MPTYDSNITLTKLVNNVKPIPTFIKDTLFKSAKDAFEETIAFEKISTKNGIARLSLPGAPAKIIKKDGRDLVYLKVPSTKEAVVFSVEEYNRYKTLGGEVIPIGQSSKDKPNRWQTWVIDQVAKLKKRVILHQERMCAQALTTGKIDITVDEINYKVDFGTIPVETIGASDKWNTDTGDPIEQLISMALQISDETGLVADTVIMGREAAKAFRNNKIYLAKLNNLNYAIGQARPLNAVNEVKGVNLISQLPENGIKIYSYHSTYLDEAGVSKNMINPKDVIITTSQAIQEDYFEFIRGPISRFAEGDAEKLETAIEYYAQKLFNEDRTEVKYQLESKSIPLIKEVKTIRKATVI